MREDIIVRAEDSTVRENIEQSAAASFTHARSKGRRWRKKRTRKRTKRKRRNNVSSGEICTPGDDEY